MKTLNKGDLFFASEKGKYRFFYPDLKEPIQCSEDISLEEVMHRVRCPKEYRGLKPYVLSREYAFKHSLPYRIIWTEHDRN